MKICQTCFNKMHSNAIKCTACGEFIGIRRIGSYLIKVIGFLSIFASTVAVIFPYMKESYGFTDSKIIAKVVNVRDDKLYVNVSNVGEKPGVLKDIGIAFGKRSLNFADKEKKLEFLLSPGKSQLLELTPFLNSSTNGKFVYSNISSIPKSYIDQNVYNSKRTNARTGTGDFSLPSEHFSLLETVGSFEVAQGECSLTYTHISFRGKEKKRIFSQDDGVLSKPCSQLRSNVFSQNTVTSKIWKNLKKFDEHIKELYKKHVYKNTKLLTD